MFLPLCWNGLRDHYVTYTCLPIPQGASSGVFYLQIIRPLQPCIVSQYTTLIRTQYKARPCAIRTNAGCKSPQLAIWMHDLSDNTIVAGHDPRSSSYHCYGGKFVFNMSTNLSSEHDRQVVSAMCMPFLQEFKDMFEIHQKHITASLALHYMPS